MNQAEKNDILLAMSQTLTLCQMKQLSNVMDQLIGEGIPEVSLNPLHENRHLLELFLRAKSTEGCSTRTIEYYSATLAAFLDSINCSLSRVTTEQLRSYLDWYSRERLAGKITLDNIRRILSSFFSWLEDEDYIVKSPVRRIHRVRSPRRVKGVFSDEALVLMSECCTNERDVSLLDMLSSTGMRICELVRLNRNDIDLDARECIVLGKGAKERRVYFDAKTKVHLKKYLDNRKDENSALFVSLDRRAHRMSIGGIELRIRQLGIASGEKAYPHKFRRTLATRAIDKGMPIEQVQEMLGHSRIETTMHYALVNESNVRLSHRKYLE